MNRFPTLATAVPLILPIKPLEITATLAGHLAYDRQVPWRDH